MLSFQKAYVSGFESAHSKFPCIMNLSQAHLIMLTQSLYQTQNLRISGLLFYLTKYLHLGPSFSTPSNLAELLFFKAHVSLTLWFYLVFSMFPEVLLKAIS